MSSESAFDMGVSRHRAAGDHTSDLIDAQAATALATANNHPLDGDEARRLHRRLLDWYFHERTKQAANRMEMAMDHDFYDGIQWADDDVAVLEERGQMPLVFNEVAPMIDWLIGTERRTRVDWKVLPRTEDDVQGADIKTKTLKYISDINRIPFARSRAFADAVKCGLGWVDSGVRDDPTKDAIYGKHEDWRNVLHDSSGYELDLEDGRFLFRTRWEDDDIAAMMFPERAAVIRRATVDVGSSPEEELDPDWYLGEQVNPSGTMYASSGGVYGDASRRRVKLIECQFRMPTMAKVVADGPFKGAFFSEHDTALADALARHGSQIIDRVMMRVHVAVFTESAMLAMGPSIYRHNKFSLTPIWCYRRGRDRMPYGAVRRIRDIQRDLNKRASKALFLLNTNQVIAEKGAVKDKNAARDEIDRPDGWVEIDNPNKKFEIRRDTEAATGQVQMMTLDAQTIQKSAGISNENLGRQTNAVSGEAIKARQLQGSVVTTEPFDNLRFAIQVDGEKQVSLMEQFYTEEKVVRLTGTKGKLEWLRINQPEQQADGSIRYLNDITASAADFVVSEQDYAGTLRQVMLDGISNLAQRLPPEVAIRLFIIGMEFSDMPNNKEVADEMRRVIGDRDPDKELTPEELQQQQEQMMAQAEAMQVQREQAMLALEEQRQRVENLAAKTAEIRARADAAGGSGMAPEHEAALRRLQEEATTKLETMAEELRKVQADAARQIMAIRREADVNVECATIDADARVRVAEINAVAKTDIESINERIAAIAKAVGMNTETAKGAASPQSDINDKQG